MSSFSSSYKTQARPHYLQDETSVNCEQYFQFNFYLRLLEMSLSGSGIIDEVDWEDIRTDNLAGKWSAPPVRRIMTAIWLSTTTSTSQCDNSLLQRAYRQHRHFIWIRQHGPYTNTHLHTDKQTDRISKKSTIKHSKSHKNADGLTHRTSFTRSLGVYCAYSRYTERIFCNCESPCQTRINPMLATSLLHYNMLYPKNFFIHLL